MRLAGQTKAPKDVLYIVRASGPLMVSDCSGDMTVPGFDLKPMKISIRNMLGACSFAELMANIVTINCETVPRLALEDRHQWSTYGIGQESLEFDMEPEPSLIPLEDAPPEDAAGSGASGSGSGALVPHVLVPNPQDPCVRLIQRLLNVGDVWWRYDLLAGELQAGVDGTQKAIALAPQELEQMLSRNIVVSETDPIGDMLVHVNSSCLHWVGTYSFSNGVRPAFSLFHEDSTNGYIHEKSKVFIVMQLRRCGWTPADPPIEPYREGGEKLFLQHWSKSRWYFVALWHHDRITCKFPADYKGGILHTMPEAYYIALLRLPPGPRFTKLLWLSMGPASDKEIRALTRSAQLDEALIPLEGEDGNGDSSDGSSADSEYSQGFLDDVDLGFWDPPTVKRICRWATGGISLGVRMPTAVKERVDIDVDLYEFGLEGQMHLVKAGLLNGPMLRCSVLFDSGTGGEQRAYCPCVRHSHGRCCKWRMTRLDATRKELLAYMLSFLIAGLRNPDWDHDAHKLDDTFTGGPNFAEVRPWIP